MGRSVAATQSAVGNVQDVSSIVKSVKADIAHLKAQLDSIPPFPEGKSVIIFEFEILSVTKSCAKFNCFHSMNRLETTVSTR